MLDLMWDYQNNTTLYPQFQENIRTSGVPVLAVWGRGDLLFVPVRAEAFNWDAKKVELHLLDVSHFALETNEEVSAKSILEFLVEHE